LKATFSASAPCCLGSSLGFISAVRSLTSFGDVGDEASGDRSGMATFQLETGVLICSEGARRCRRLGWRRFPLPDLLLCASAMDEEHWFRCGGNEISVEGWVWLGFGFVEQRCERDPNQTAASKRERERERLRGTQIKPPDPTHRRTQPTAGSERERGNV